MCDYFAIFAIIRDYSQLSQFFAIIRDIFNDYYSHCDEIGMEHLMYSMKHNTLPIHL